MIPFFSYVDERDGRTERYNIQVLMNFPKSMRHDLKLQEGVKRMTGLTGIAFFFNLLYPLLGGVFFQAGVFVQACLIPVFFLFRFCFEWMSDAEITKTFGSDKLPALSFFGVRSYYSNLYPSLIHHSNTITGTFARNMSSVMIT